VPKTTVPPDYIEQVLTEELISNKPTAKVVWLGRLPSVEHYTKSKKGNTWEMSTLTFQGKKETVSINISQPQGIWLSNMLQQLSVSNIKTYTLQEVKDSYEAAGLEDFELFWDNKPVNGLYKLGLLTL